MTKLSMLFAVFLAAATPCFGASISCSPQVKVLRNLPVALLGGDLRYLPEDTGPGKRCYLTKKYADCEFTDSQGTAYLVEGRILVRVEKRRGKQIRDLPLDLKFGMTIVQSIKSIDRVDHTLVLFITQVEDHVVIGSGVCLKNDRGSVFDLYLIFDRTGLLRTVGARVPSGSD